jgi:hypothetical protein
VTGAIQARWQLQMWQTIHKGALRKYQSTTNARSERQIELLALPRASLGLPAVKGQPISHGDEGAARGLAEKALHQRKYLEEANNVDRDSVSAIFQVDASK